MWKNTIIYAFHFYPQHQFPICNAFFFSKFFFLFLWAPDFQLISVSCLYSFWNWTVRSFILFFFIFSTKASMVEKGFCWKSEFEKRDAQTYCRVIILSLVELWIIFSIFWNPRKRWVCVDERDSQVALNGFNCSTFWPAAKADDALFHGNW